MIARGSILLGKVVDAWLKALSSASYFEQRGGSIKKCDRQKANRGRIENATAKRRAHNRMAADSRRAQQRRAA
jgi:hypothetical protein